MCTSGKTEKKVRRPFHETIVDQLRENGVFFSNLLVPIGRLLMATKILENHDAIIAALYDRYEELADVEDPFFANVLDDLREQKEEAEAEAEAKAKTKEKALREWSDAT